MLGKYPCYCSGKLAFPAKKNDVMSEFKIINADVLKGLKQLETESIDCVFTSPPYWGLRDYGVEGQLGLEKTFQEYLEKLVIVFDEVKRVLKPEGTCWINLGDTYCSKGESRHKGYSDPKQPKLGVKNFNEPSGLPQSVSEKSLCNIPARFSIAMQDKGWILRNTIIWQKPSCMPCSVKDRFTVDFEYLFFFVKQKKYFFEQQFEPLSEVTIKDIGKRTNLACLTGKNNSKNFLINNPEKVGRTRNEYVNLETGRNMRAVWSINPEPYKESHFAVFPTELVRRGLKAGCPKQGIVLDPFIGSGTTLFVAQELGLNGIGIELNAKYIPLMKKRLLGDEKQTSLNKNKIEIKV